MKKIFLFILCLAAVLLVLGNFFIARDPLVEEIRWQDSAAEEQISADVEEVSAVALTDDELQALTALFDTPAYNGFLEKPFSSPEDISWDAVLRNGAGLTVQDVSEEEVSSYLDATGQKKLYGDLFVIRKSDLAEYIRKYTGTDFIPGEKDLAWDYIAERDSFYTLHWAGEYIAFTCVSGEKAGNRYTLRFAISDERSAGIDPRSHSGAFADRILTAVKSGDDYIMVSNAFLWDDHSDSELTFDVQLSQYDKPVRFITYSENPERVSVVLVKDGKQLTELSTYVMTDNFGYLKKLNAVGFFDFNADGMKDIALIGDSDDGRHVILHEAVTGEYAFDYFADLDEKKMAEIGAEFSADSIQAALLGSRQEDAYGSWQEVYTQIAKVHHITDDGYRYELIYADGDEIPELVVGYPGYRVSLFTYENGYAHCLMNNWPYGAGGNSGYSYVPRMGIYYNGNADYAGAIYYDSYMSAREGGEIDTDYWVKNINFNDLNGDGEPSEDELAASGEYTGTSEYHNETDREMTEEEIKAMVDLYSSYEMKYLSGDIDYESLLAQLGV